MIPTIHLNGTAQSALVDELATAHGAVTQALEAVQNMTVHGRDYYPQGPRAFNQAREEHIIRLRKLEEVQAELLQMAIAVGASARR